MSTIPLAIHRLADGRTLHISDGQAFYRLAGSANLINVTPRRAIALLAEARATKHEEE